MPAYEPVCFRPEFPPWICQGTSCSNATSEAQSQCQCAPSWKHDGAIYHIANCSEPVIFVPVLCGVCLFWLAGMQYSIIRRRRVMCAKRNSAKKISPATVVMLSSQATVLSLMSACISLLAVGVSSVPYFLFLTLSAQFISISLTTTVVAYARIVYASVAAGFPERTYQMVYVASVTLLGFPFWFIMLPGSSYMDNNPEQGNLLIAIAICLVPTQLTVTGPVLLSASRRLIREMKINQLHLKGHSKESSDSANTITGSVMSERAQKMGRTLHRIHLFQVANIGAILGDVIFCVGAGMTYVAGRVPYQWIIVTLLFSTLLATTHVFIVATADGSALVGTSTSPPPIRRENSKSSTNKGGGSHSQLDSPKGTGSLAVAVQPESPTLTRKTAAAVVSGTNQVEDNGGGG